MRFLTTLENPDQAKGLAALFKDRGIDHELEVKTNTNWGDDHYGRQTFNMWIVDEDMYDQAKDLSQHFLQNPHDEALKPKNRAAFNFFNPKREKRKKVITLIPDPPVIPQGPSFVTRMVVLLCAILFLLEESTLSDKPGIRSTLWVPSPILQALLYDYPEAAQLYTKVMDIWAGKGSESIPPEGVLLIEKAKNTPYWHGYYDEVVARLRGDKPLVQGPLFEKIRQGQIWRIFTPALLHGGFLHILFNMLWLWLLGKEVERILGGGRYLLLMALIAAASDTSQYLMSGFEFLGFSGVIAGLALFIGERQKKAPWEGYTLQRSIYMFLVIYIFGLAALEGVSFILEASGHAGLPSFVGNTAHVSGAILGYILGRTNLFAWKG